MKKLQIFFAAFLISFLTIYSVYYYTQINKLDESVVAMAKDLTHTVMGEDDGNKKDQNLIFTRGIYQVMPSWFKDDTTLFTADVPDKEFVSFNAVKSKENLEKFYEGLVTKFINHPPIDFGEVKDGDKIAMSYYFDNIRLPAGFRVSASDVDYQGKKVKSLQYRPKKADTSLVKFFKGSQPGEYAFLLRFDGGKKRVVIYNYRSDTTWLGAYYNANKLIKNDKSLYTPAADESVLFPELDFNFVKDFDFDMQKSNPGMKDYQLVQERIKFKISAPKEGGPMEASAKFNTPKNIIMNDKVLYFVEEAGKGRPYCIISLKNPEILKVVKEKRSK